MYLFEQIAEDEYRCVFCQVVNLIAVKNVPSMMAGDETYVSCANCGATEHPVSPFTCEVEIECACKNKGKIGLRDGEVIFTVCGGIHYQTAQRVLGLV